MYTCKIGVCPKNKTECCYTCGEYATCDTKCILPDGDFENCEDIGTKNE